MSWGVHNSLKGWTFYGLSDREMQIIVKTLSINEMKLTLVCRNGEVKWSALNEKNFPELYQALTSVSDGFPPLENPTQETIDTDYFIVRPKRAIQPRLHKRYESQIPCVVFSSTRQFKTNTIDLSEGGLNFKETLPDWVAGYFLVGVQGPGTVFQLMCSMVEDQKERHRVQIVSEEQDAHYLAYKEWLLALNP